MWTTLQTVMHKTQFNRVKFALMAAVLAFSSTMTAIGPLAQTTLAADHDGSITNLRMSTRDASNYTGIVVDFHVNDDFENATSLTVKIDRASGSPITKSLSSTLVESLVNQDRTVGSTDPITAPFPIFEYTYSEADDTAWSGTSADKTWDSSTIPINATVTIQTPDGPITETTDSLIGTYESVAPYQYPSTNEKNKNGTAPSPVVNGLQGPHVNKVGQGVDEITLEFVNPQNYLECFEYRIDGVSVDKNVTSYQDFVAGDSHPIVTGHVVYPQVCLEGATGEDSPLAYTFTATEKVEVRLAVGSERDWDFDWTPFYVAGVIISPEADESIEKETAIELFAKDVGAKNGGVQWAVKKGHGSCYGTTVFGNVDGKNTPYTWADGTFEATISTTSLAPGKYCFVLNPAQGERLTRNFTVTPDTTAPAAPQIIKPTNEQHFNNQPILNEWTSVSDPSGIDYYQVAYLYDDLHKFSGSTCLGEEIDGQELSGCRNENGTSRNHTPNSDEQGGVTVWVRAFDKAGNASDWSDPVHYYYDTTAPAAPELTYPANGSVINATSPIANDWEDVADAKFYTYQSYDVDGNGDCDLSDDRWTEDYTDSQTNSRAIEDGLTFCWRVKAVDAAGNESDWSKLWKVTIDNTAPAKVEGLQIRKGNSANGELIGCGGYTNSELIRIEWNHSPEDDIDYYWFGTRTKENHKKVNANQNYYNGDINPAKAPFYYTVIAVDKAGNESPISDKCHLTLDTEAPMAEILNPNDGDFVDGVVALEGKVTDDHPMNTHFEVQDENGDRVAHKTRENSNDTILNFDWDTTGRADGTYTIYFEAKDKAGNKDGSRANPGPSVDVITVKIDRTAPEIEIKNILVSLDKKLSFDLLAADAGPAGLKHVAANIYDEDNVVKVIELGSGNPTRLNVPHDGLSLGTPSFDTSLNDIDVSGLTTGTYTIRAFARDHADNELRFELAQFTVDNTDPAVDAGADDDVDGLAYALNGTASDGETGLAGTLWTLESGPGTATADFDDDAAPGTNVIVSAVGTYTFKLTATDNAGNTAEDTVTIKFNPVQGASTADEDKDDEKEQSSQNNFVALNSTGGNNTEYKEDKEKTEEKAILSQTDGEDGGETKDTEVITTTSGSSSFFSNWWWALLLAALLIAGYFYATRVSKSKK